MFLSFISSIIFLTLWAANNGLVLKNTPENKPENHLKNEDDGSLQVDLDINDDDYDWVQYNIQLKEQFEELESSSIKQYDNADENVKHEKPTEMINKTDIDNKEKSEAVYTLASIHSIKKRETIGTGQDQINRKHDYAEKNNDSTFLKHLYGIKVGMRYLHYQPFTLPMFGHRPSLGYVRMSLNPIRWHTAKCLFADYKENRQPLSVLAARVWRVALIWLSVYAAVAVPFWCIKGWCCCCLRCKFLKPQETIQEAKDYLLLNPPGVLITKKGAIIHYEPTEREKDCYEEFGHFIRTL